MQFKNTSLPRQCSVADFLRYYLLEYLKMTNYYNLLWRCLKKFLIRTSSGKELKKFQWKNK